MYAYHQRGATTPHTWDECPEGKLIPEHGEGGLPKCEPCAVSSETDRRHLDYITPKFGKR